MLGLWSPFCTLTQIWDRSLTIRSRISTANQISLVVSVHVDNLQDSLGPYIRQCGLVSMSRINRNHIICFILFYACLVSVYKS